MRPNAELFVALRNKVEHRYEHNLRILTGGRAQAYVINYEQEMAGYFGGGYSLADRLRFPLSVQALTADGYEEMRKAARELPRKPRDLVARYEAGIDPSVLDDLRYDYRVRLVPITGSKTDADLALRQRAADEDGGRSVEEGGVEGVASREDRRGGTAVTRAIDGGGRQASQWFALPSRSRRPDSRAVGNPPGSHT